MSLSHAQAIKLLELGKSKGRVPMVRIFGKDAEQHAHRAMLIGVNGKNAVVKPQGHRRIEEVDLAKVNLWKSGNDFDLTEVQALDEPIELVKAIECDNAQRFLVYNPSVKGYWHGENRRWQTSPMQALEYANGTEGPILISLIERFGPFLRLVPIEEARFDWVNQQKKQYNVHVSDERMHLERQRSHLLEEYGLLKDKLLDLDRQIRELGGRAIVSTVPPPGVLPAPEINCSKKNVHIKKDVLAVLRECPNITSEEVYSRILVRYPHYTFLKIRNCLYNMRRIGDVIYENKKWRVNQSKF